MKTTPTIRSLFILIIFMICGSGLMSQTKSLNQVAKDIALSFATADTTMIQSLIIPKDEYHKILRNQNYDSLGVESWSDAQIEEEYNMMKRTVTYMFLFETLKFQFFDIKVESDSLKYEVVQMPEPMRSVMVYVPIENEQFHWMQFILDPYGENWYLTTPYFRISEEKEKLK